jgi:hypothetical protein
MGEAVGDAGGFRECALVQDVGGKGYGEGAIGGGVKE